MRATALRLGLTHRAGSAAEQGFEAAFVVAAGNANAGGDADAIVGDVKRRVERFVYTFREALEMLESCNPLPNVTGRVCPQELQCQGMCLHKKSMSIGQLEWFLPEWEKLADPEGLFLASNVVPLVSTDVADEIADVLNPISAALTPEGLVALNVQSVDDQKSSADIATQWLQENGFGA